MATMQSMSPCSVTPASCISFTAPPSASSASVYDSRRRREAGDVALEQQLAPCRILQGERDERAQVLLQRGAGLTGERERVEPLEQLPVAVGEHRVVERVLRVEVLVERRLAHPDLAGQGMQRDRRRSPCSRASRQAAATIDATFASRRCRHLVGHQSALRTRPRPTTAATIAAPRCGEALQPTAAWIRRGSTGVTRRSRRQLVVSRRAQPPACPGDQPGGVCSAAVFMRRWTSSSMPKRPSAPLRWITVTDVLIQETTHRHSKSIAAFTHRSSVKPRSAALGGRRRRHQDCRRGHRLPEAASSSANLYRYFQHPARRRGPPDGFFAWRPTTTRRSADHAPDR